MEKLKIIQSPNLNIDTLKCPKCNVLWRAEGHYNYDEGGWNYFNEETGIDEDICPNGCTNFFGFRIRGKMTPRD